MRPRSTAGQVSMREMEYDVVIIGSGAGGGVVAKELAPLCADGKKIVVLEWGAKLKDEEFTGREVDMASKLFFDSGGTFTKDRSMTLAYGRAYGGSTVIYTGTSLKMPEEVIGKWDVQGLESADLDRRFEKYIEENNVHLLSDEEINDNNRLFLEGCRKLGYHVEQFPINVTGCRGSSFCNLGCPNQAKQGTDQVQLPMAESQGVEVITNCRVTRIADRVCEAVVAEPGYGEASKWEAGEYRVRAKIVVVCAGGVVNSPGLLLRSGFGQGLPMLGRSITLHPALILVGEHGQRVFWLAVGGRVGARLEAAGIPYTESRSGRQALFCRDPDANALELIEQTANGGGHHIGAIDDQLHRRRSHLLYNLQGRVVCRARWGWGWQEDIFSSQITRLPRGLMTMLSGPENWRRPCDSKTIQSFSPVGSYSITSPDCCPPPLLDVNHR